MNRYIWSVTDSADFNLSQRSDEQSERGIDLYLNDTTNETVLPNPGDELLIMLSQQGYTQVRPKVWQVQSIANNKVNATAKADYRNPVSVDDVRQVMQRGLKSGFNQVNEKEFQAIVAQMGGIRIKEKLLLDHIKRYITARGYYFDDETLYNYHVCMKTRPFVILAGLSGTGKSKLSQLYAEAIGHTVRNGRYLRLAVRPGWNDDRYLLGYFNTVANAYMTEPALDFILRAEQDRRNLHFFCLDEMNLAHVEYYFSQFLSAMEEENPADRRIVLYGDSLKRRLEADGQKLDVEQVVFLPANLLFTGTINVDETTQPISDKVVDRANTIEFFEVALDKIPERQAPPEPLDVSADLWRSYRTSDPDARFRDHIVAIGNILNEGSLGLGYRVLREIELYIANSQGLLAPEVAFDLQIKQRILPRLRGTLTIQKMLRSLQNYVTENGWQRSAQRLTEMEGRLKRDGYTSFWR